MIVNSAVWTLPAAANCRNSRCGPGSVACPHEFDSAVLLIGLLRVDMGIGQVGLGERHKMPKRPEIRLERHRFVRFIDDGERERGFVRTRQPTGDDDGLPVNRRRG